jgi:hypothetical protein
MLQFTIMLLQMEALLPHYRSCRCIRHFGRLSSLVRAIKTQRGGFPDGKVLRPQKRPRSLFASYDLPLNFHPVAGHISQGRQCCGSQRLHVHAAKSGTARINVQGSLINIRKDRHGATHFEIELNVREGMITSSPGLRRQSIAVISSAPSRERQKCRAFAPSKRVSSKS